MDIYEYALKMEKDGEEFYREIASKTSDQGLKTITSALADQEVRHYNAIAEMQKGDCRIEDSDLLAGIRNIFSQIRPDKMFDADSKQIEAYREAQEIEQQSIEFYREKAAVTADPQQKALFERLATEEEKHYFILDNIIEFLSRPQQWLENAEWYHLDEY